MPVSSHHNESGIDVISENTCSENGSMGKGKKQNPEVTKKEAEQQSKKKASGGNKDQLEKLPVIAPAKGAVKTNRSQSVPYGRIFFKMNSPL